uniref:Uncharacterized protein n=1 Tax=Rhizophora mucronata TaxID=61149 RepID=A0A2P2NWF1_RHIMU
MPNILVNELASSIQCCSKV